MRRYSKNPVGAHYGLGDWLLQRLTAVVMAGYTIFVLGCLLAGRPASYADMKAMFSDGFIRIFTMLFVVAMAYHAWIGMRDILMDYVHATSARLMGQVAVGVVLVGYVIWGASILWGPRP